MPKLHVVPGGAAFIGSHLVKALLQKGLRVRVADNFSSGHKKNIPSKAEVIKGDVTETAVRAVKDASVVYHLAARPSVPLSIEQPLVTHRATVDTTVAVLDAAARAGVQRVVFASSASVYGNTDTGAKHEGLTPNPMSPYAVAKLCSEHYMKYWGEHSELSTVSLRFFNVYGPGQGRPSGYAAVIPHFVTCSAKGKPFPIFGNGQQTRDFTYVGEVIRGILLAGAAAHITQPIYNLAAGQRISVEELAKAVSAQASVPLNIQPLPVRQGDILHSWADIRAAQRDLGFAPGLTLDEGLRLTMK